MIHVPCYWPKNGRLAASMKAHKRQSGAHIGNVNAPSEERCRCYFLKRILETSADGVDPAQTE
jgi:hypothetical protein